MPSQSIGIVDLDLAVDSSTGALAVDPTLKTAILISFGSRARAKPDDRLQDPTELGGWWGDAFADVPGDNFGSRFWTLQGLHMGEALPLAEPIAREALQWMVEDGLADSFEIEVEAVQKDRIGIRVGVVQPGDTLIRWSDVWLLSLASR